MPKYAKRWPKQPWLYPESDLKPQGAPECQVFTGNTVLLALHVRGLPTHEMIAIRWDGGPVSALIPDEGIPIDTHPED